MKEIIYTVFAPGADMTFIMCDTYDGEELRSSEVVGWYYGAPTEAETEEFTGKLKAEY